MSSEQGDKNDNENSNARLWQRWTRPCQNTDKTIITNARDINDSTEKTPAPKKIAIKYPIETVNMVLGVAEVLINP